MIAHHLLTWTVAVAVVVALCGSCTAVTPFHLPAVVSVPAAACSANCSNPEISYSVMNVSLFAGNSTARVAVIGNPVGHWHVYCPMNANTSQCSGVRITVVDQAVRHNCIYATNGGPFYLLQDGVIGPTISDGSLVSNLTLLSGDQCVGLTNDGRWLIGSIDPSVFGVLENMVCGFGWLVFDGKIIPTAGGLIAPRTALGIDMRGRLVSVVVDGSEIARTGATDEQMAVFMLKRGARYAISMDGGGSSTTYFRPLGGLQGCPTCIDYPVCCQRMVTTMTCVR